MTKADKVALNCEIKTATDARLKRVKLEMAEALGVAVVSYGRVVDELAMFYERHITSTKSLRTVGTSDKVQ